MRILAVDQGTTSTRVLELMNRRVRSTADLAEALDIPVLGSIAHIGARA